MIIFFFCIVYYIMGGTKSKAVYNAVVNSVTNIAISYTNECYSSVEQDQNIDATNKGFQLWGMLGISQSQQFDVSCALNSQNITKLQERIINTLSQQLVTENSSLFPSLGETKSEMEANIRTNIENSITSEILHRNISKANQTQNINATNYGMQLFWNITLDQGQKTFVNSIMTALQDSDLMSDLENDVNQDGDTTNNDVFSKLMETISEFWWLLILFIITGIGFMIFLAVGGFVLYRVTSTSSQTIDDKID